MLSSDNVAMTLNDIIVHLEGIYSSKVQSTGGGGGGGDVSLKHSSSPPPIFTQLQLNIFMDTVLTWLSVYVAIKMVPEMSFCLSDHVRINLRE